jgi:hypothetical protein
MIEHPLKVRLSLSWANPAEAERQISAKRINRPRTDFACVAAIFE